MWADLEQSLLRYHEEKPERATVHGRPLSTGTECAGADGLCLPHASGCGCGCPCKSLGTFWMPWPGRVQALGTVNAAAGQHIPHSLWRRCSLCRGPGRRRSCPGAAAGARGQQLEGSRVSSWSGKATRGSSQKWRQLRQGCRWSQARAGCWPRKGAQVHSEAWDLDIMGGEREKELIKCRQSGFKTDVTLGLAFVQAVWQPCQTK